MGSVGMGVKINEAKHNMRWSVQSRRDLKMRVVQIAWTLVSECKIVKRLALQWGKNHIGFTDGREGNTHPCFFDTLHNSLCAKYWWC